MNKTLGKILIVGAILVAGGALIRGFYYAPNDEIELVNESGTLTSSTDESGQIDSGLLASIARTPPAANVALPVNIDIPKINVDAKVLHMGVTAKGNMAAPKTYPDVGWYKYGVVPGKPGSAVMAGHVDNGAGTPAVFYNLNKLAVGDELTVTDKNGNELRFRVVKKEIHPYNLSGPKLQEIFNAPKDKARLNLITCTGTWLPAAKTNDKRLVVYTELVS